ncbi:hypothetical protein G6F50_014265 [Rhizopus delemar]|uniref:Major facilitator superfamily (MFS) profile domain-containing protein n=1 Tax=Rhizopus delemar TaxID=936053 RepID=A0A9P7C8X5_9FUNG|nr:hypothetical protein G6F50_014265 [Rhizopus delemar]
MPRRRLLIALMGLFAIGTGLSAIAPDYHWMLFFRFLSGLPHGAYFGIASLVASSLVPANRRTMAVGRVFLGLTVATIVGVPLANWMGQVIGWRWSFALVSLLAVLTMVSVAIFAPDTPADHKASPLRELSALGRGQVWITLAIGAVGFGGLFSVYTYLADTLGAVTQVSPSVVPFVLSAFGVGLTVGNMVVPIFADRAVMRTAGLLLLWSAVVLALFPLMAHNVWLITLNVFLVGAGGALGTAWPRR